MPETPPRNPCEVGAPLASTNPCAKTLDLLSQRRSTPIAMFQEPGPSRDDITQLLTLAMRAPDHRKLEPWRFLVFTGEARNRLGEIFSAAKQNGSEIAQEQARAMPLRAPSIVAIISSPVDCPKGTPKWEQELSTGAVCQNLLIAANASGWAASWISEWPMFDDKVAEQLSLKSNERIAGFVYLGTAKHPPLERQRPTPADKITFWDET